MSSKGDLSFSIHKKATCILLKWTGPSNHAQTHCIFWITSLSLKFLVPFCSYHSPFCLVRTVTFNSTGSAASLFQACCNSAPLLSTIIPVALISSVMFEAWNPSSSRQLLERAPSCRTHSNSKDHWNWLWLLTGLIMLGINLLPFKGTRPNVLTLR